MTAADEKPKRKRKPGNKARSKSAGKPRAPRPVKDKTDTNPKGAGAPELFPVEVVAAALRKNFGLKAQTAVTLGCAYNTLTGYLERYPELLDVIDECGEIGLDMAEGALIQALRRGDGWAVALMLRTKGRSRGYGEKGTFEGLRGRGAINPGTGGFEIEFVDVDPVLDRPLTR